MPIEPSRCASNHPLTATPTALNSVLHLKEVRWCLECQWCGDTSRVAMLCSVVLCRPDKRTSRVTPAVITSHLLYLPEIKVVAWRRRALAQPPSAEWNPVVMACRATVQWNLPMRRGTDRALTRGLPTRWRRPPPNEPRHGGAPSHSRRGCLRPPQHLAEHGWQSEGGASCL